MATSFSYATSNLTETLLLHNLPDFGENGDGIINSNLLTAFLNAKGSKKVVPGGLEFWNPIRVNENTNAKWQGKDDEFSVNSQDPSNRLRFPIQVFTDTVILNNLDVAMNKGRAAIKNFVQEQKEQAQDTIENSFNGAWWNETPADTEPVSVPQIISTTPTTGTIGGLQRSSSKALQNLLFSTAIADIGSEAGIAKLIELNARARIRKQKPDLIVMAENLWAGLAGFLATQRRFKTDDAMAKIGFDMLQLTAGTLIGSEELDEDILGDHSTINPSRVYGINTKHMIIKVLADGNSKWGDKFERIGKSMNKMLPFEWYGNLTTNLPRAHWLASDVSVT